MSLEDGPTLIAFDGSAAARHAVEVAGKLLRPRKTLLITVWEAALANAAAASAPNATGLPMFDPSAGMQIGDELRRHAESVANEGAELAKSLGLDAEPFAAVGVRSVADTIVEFAQSHDVATIVVGSRGLSGLRARFEGSTSRDVVKNASSPVLVVHDAADGD
ncbi:MAG TPA: universal stress protein [Solirubrobacteraceae bacterium]|nr:universal stress protein [Solirubrobacteraceae bacterium]